MFFKIANSNCPVGYCTLELILRGRTVPIIDNSLVPLHGNHFLSSSLFPIEYNKLYTLIGAETLTGPAQTCILPSGHSMDHVYTLIGAETMTGPAQTCIIPSGHSTDHV